MATATCGSRSTLVGTIMGDIQSLEQKLTQLKQRVAALEIVDTEDDDDFEDIDDLFEDDVAAIDVPEIPENFQGLLSFDLQISETSPLIRGTWITVEEVVGYIMAGHPRSDILRYHPELTEDDIRTALAYTIATE